MIELLFESPIVRGYPVAASEDAAPAEPSGCRKSAAFEVLMRIARLE